MRLRINAEMEQLIAMALKEDVGPGDVTSEATIPGDQKGAGLIFAKSAGVLCGVDVARCVLRLADPRVQMKILAEDGDISHRWSGNRPIERFHAFHSDGGAGNAEFPPATVGSRDAHAAVCGRAAGEWESNGGGRYAQDDAVVANVGATRRAGGRWRESPLRAL